MNRPLALRRAWLVLGVAACVPWARAQTAAGTPGPASSSGSRAPAASLSLGGVMGSRAMLVIDGAPQMLAVGQSARGVKLLAVDGDSAQVERDGQRSVLRVGGAPVTLAAGGGVRSAAREIVLAAGPGGHFITGGAINGRTVSFMVDTGATTVAMGEAEAARLGLDLRNAKRGQASTANGLVTVAAVTLDSVRVGEVEVRQVAAVVLPMDMPHILLGNSFLTRFQLRRDNDVMRLELRR